MLTDLFLPFLSDDVLFYGPECPYLYKGKRDLNFEERFDALLANVDSRKNLYKTTTVCAGKRGICHSEVRIKR